MKTTLGILDLIFFSDEAHFRLSGHVSKQNMRFWALTQPHEHIQPPLNQKKSNSVVRNWIAGPFFFEDNDGNHVTINSESYIEMLQGSLFQPSEEGTLTSTQLCSSKMGHHLIAQTELLST